MGDFLTSLPLPPPPRPSLSSFEVAPYYTVMNDVMSGGLHRIWKDSLVRQLNPGPGIHHLDMAGGTGDVGMRVLRAMRSEEKRRGVRLGKKEEEGGTVTIADINPEMLEEGKKYWGGRNEAGGVHWVVADAEALPFEDKSFDSYTIAFGIRNVTKIDKALSEAYRVLKPGGCFLCLEFSTVSSPLLRPFYSFYSHQVIPRMGELVAGDAASYRYLIESIERFPPQEDFKGMIEGAGFRNVGYSNLTEGVVAIHRGFKV